jgi:hypothetical protein
VRIADAGAFVDIGAHVGFYLWSLLPPSSGTPGDSFEPHPKLFHFFKPMRLASRQTYEDPPLPSTITTAFTELHVDTNDWSMSTLVQDRAPGIRTGVPCSVLESVTGKNGVHIAQSR